MKADLEINEQLNKLTLVSLSTLKGELDARIDSAIKTSSLMNVCL